MNVDIFGLHLSKRKKTEVDRFVCCSCVLKYTKDGHVDACNKILKNLVSPVDKNDGATKQYVDTSVEDLRQTIDLKLTSLSQITNELSKRVQSLEEIIYQQNKSKIKTNKK